MKPLFERVDNGLRVWDSYVRTFLSPGVSDGELSAAMMDAAAFNFN